MFTKCGREETHISVHHLVITAQNTTLTFLIILFALVYIRMICPILTKSSAYFDIHTHRFTLQHFGAPSDILLAARKVDVTDRYKRRTEADQNQTTFNVSLKKVNNHYITQ